MIELVTTPIDTNAVLRQVASPDAGAVVLFLGTTRRFTDGRETSSLDYECFAEMARRKMAELEAEHAKTAIAEVNETFRAEVKGDDPYVRRWRPTFGYAVALTWCLQVAGLVYAIVARPEQAAAIVGAMDSLTIIWGVALSVLGVSVVKRSADKAAAAGAAPTGALAALIQAFAARKKG